MPGNPGLMPSAYIRDVVSLGGEYQYDAASRITDENEQVIHQHL